MRAFTANRDSDAMTRVKNDFRTGLLMLVGVALFAFLGLYQQAPPAAKPFDAPPTEFSATRALMHLAVIAQRHHEMGTPEHAKVRDYLVGELTTLGVSPEVQKTESVNVRAQGAYGGTVENVVARLRGTDNSKAVLLVSHYDSVPTGPGANDDGVAVAALLETLRALKAGAPLKNDVILLFTDGEENGLLGAKAFVAEHPWAKDVGVVFNFEARGHGGPSTMFETSNGNGRLIGEFARATPYPNANSLSADIYKLLPNDTDMSMFKDAGMPGLNFAYIEGLPDYHTQLDSVAHVNERSLQHHGTHALALARHFGNRPGGVERAGNAVYFDTLGAALLHYPFSWIMPLTIFVLLAFVAVVGFGLKRRHLTIKGIVFGVLVSLLSIVTSAVAVLLVWMGVMMLHASYRRMTFGATYNSDLYFYSFAALTCAIVTTFVVLFRKKVGAANLLVGGLCWWALLLVLSSLYLPGGSYLFTWPLLFTLLGAGVLFALEPDGALPQQLAIVLLLCAVPGVLLFVPLIYQIFLALTVHLAWVTTILLVLVLFLLSTHLNLATSQRRWLLPGVALLVSVCFLVAGSMTASFDRSKPEPYHLIYGLDADKNEAVWASADDRPGGWTAQFFTAGVQRRPLDMFYHRNPRTFLVGNAPVLPLAAPAATLLEDSKVDDRRVLRVRVDAPAPATTVVINVDTEARIISAQLGGKQIAANEAMAQKLYAKGLGLRYYAPQPGGIELRLELSAQAPITLRVVSINSELPQVPNNAALNQRPDNMLPAPYLTNNSTMVTKQFTF